MHALALLILLLLAGCASTLPSAPPAVGAAPFPVAEFFTGRLDGEGMIRVLSQEPRPVRVRSHGRMEADGTLTLVQRIDEQGKPRRERVWRLRETAPGRFTGTLDEADGPVVAEVRGGSLRIAYTMSGGMEVDQLLTMLPGGRSAQNRLVVRKLGIPIATVDEMIVKLD